MIICLFTFLLWEDLITEVTVEDLDRLILNAEVNQSLRKIYMKEKV